METALEVKPNGQLNRAPELSPDIIQSLVFNGDMSKLDPKQQLEYYNAMCHRIGVDPAAQPFGLIKLQGKLVLYANRGCAQQLNQKFKLSHSITSRELIGEIYVVQCRTSDPSGRFTDTSGAVNIEGVKGETLANLYMKAETKAKRRGTLDFCGLGITSEEEIDHIEKYVPVEGAAVPMLEKKAPYPKKAVMENAEELQYAGGDGNLFISEITETTFTVKKKPFQVYRIIGTDNQTYNTSKKEKYEFAQKALDEGTPVIIEYRSSEYEGWALMDIVEYSEDGSLVEDIDHLKAEHDAKLEKEINEVFPK